MPNSILQYKEKHSTIEQYCRELSIEWSHLGQFCPQTQKFEPHFMTEGLLLGLKESFAAAWNCPLLLFYYCKLEEIKSNLQ